MSSVTTSYVPVTFAASMAALSSSVVQPVLAMIRGGAIPSSFAS
jgi:hypothetical protein